MKNNKICFYPGDLNPGGIGHLMINLAQEFSRQGYEVHFFLTNRPGLIEDELPKEIKIFRFGNSVKSTFKGLISYMKKENPTAIISARDNSNIVNILACIFAKKNTKSISSVHVDYSSVAQKHSLKTKLYRLFVYVLGLLFYRFSDEIIAVSKGVADNHAKRFFLNRKKITVIYNPTYKEIHSTEEETIKSFIDKMPKPVITAVGRLTTQKGFNILIDAFSLFKKNNNSGSLLILGEGEDREKLKEQALKLNIDKSVFLAGYVKTPGLYVQYSDLFVCSSLWEGFGNVIVEALGVGAKVVSTDCKSGPREILCDGKYGILVPINDPKELAVGIEKQLMTSVSKDDQINRAKDFSVNKISKEYLDLIYK